jgi:hypothetical protein
MDSVQGTLREWALIADSIASLQCTHHQRQQRIDTLISIVEDYSHLHRPVWHQTLLNLLKQSTNHRLNYNHTEMRGLLNLWRDICLHVADHYEDWWLAWVQESDEPKPERKADKHDPFKDFLEEDDDEDDTKS